MSHLVDVEEMARVEGERVVASMERLQALMDEAPLDAVALGRTPPPPPDFVLPGLLAGTVGVLTGRGGRGKSLVALRLALGVAATGDDLSLASDGWAPGWATPRAGRVIVLSLEDPEGELHRRWHRLWSREVARGIADSVLTDAARRVELRPWAGRLPGALLGTGLEDLFVDWLIERAHSARLVIVDTLRRAHGYDENQSWYMTAVMAALERVATETGAAVLAVHHEGKGDREGADASRGSTVITDHARWVARLGAPARDDEEAHRRRLVALDVVKSNYGRPAERVWLSLDVLGAEGVPVVVTPPGVDTSEVPGVSARAMQRWGAAS